MDYESLGNSLLSGSGYAIDHVNTAFTDQFLLDIWYSVVEFAMYKRYGSLPITAFRARAIDTAAEVIEKPDPIHAPETATLMDLLKYLVIHVLWLTKSVQTESSLALNCARFRNATLEDEMFNVLGHVVASSKQSLDVIIDVEMLGLGDSGFNCCTVHRTRLMMGFRKLLGNMRTRNVNVRFHVLLVSHDPSVSGHMEQEDSKDVEHPCNCCAGKLPNNIPVTEYARAKRFSDSAYTDLLSQSDPGIFAL